MSWYKVRPLVDWSGPRTDAGARRSRYAFKAGWSSTEELLERELFYLDARDVVLQVAVRDSDLRVDGTLRANARQPSDPGVRLIATTRHGDLSWQTDVCAFWQHNVRSIALGLEALRAVDRYGISQRGQQYRGWREIEAGSGHTTEAEACQVLWAWSGVKVTPGESEQSLRARWREARAASHPDRNGGNSTGWHAVEDAARTLGLSR